MFAVPGVLSVPTPKPIRPVRIALPPPMAATIAGQTFPRLVAPAVMTCRLAGVLSRVALLLVQGLDSEALAAELGVRLPTVKSHLGVILRRYGMESRAHDVRRYLAR
jgi:DNA-binding NarL/FixJ family response regulator